MLTFQIHQKTQALLLVSTFLHQLDDTSIFVLSPSKKKKNILNNNNLLSPICARLRRKSQKHLQFKSWTEKH